MYNWLTSGTREKTRGLGWEHNDDLKRPKNVEILVAPPLANERRTTRISFNVNNSKNRIEICGFAAEEKCDKLE